MPVLFLLKFINVNGDSLQIPVVDGVEGNSPAVNIAVILIKIEIVSGFGALGSIAE